MDIVVRSILLLLVMTVFMGIIITGIRSLIGGRNQ